MPVRPSVRLFTWNRRALTGRKVVKFLLGIFTNVSIYRTKTTDTLTMVTPITKGTNIRVVTKVTDGPMVTMVTRVTYLLNYLLSYLLNYLLTYLIT
jgi:hypothetical protein